MKVATLIYVSLGISICVSLLLFWRFKSRADRRACQLLRAVLTQEQYRQLFRWGYIDIKSPSAPQRFYRVPQVPGVVHMIEADEETYLQKANRIVPIGTTTLNGGDLVEMSRFFMVYHL